MSEIGDLMDAWFGWHVHHGTLVARTWSPTPATDDEMEEAREALNGPPWTQEIEELYRWSNGTNGNFVLPFGSLSPLPRLVESSPADYFFVYESDDLPNPRALNISPDCSVCIDRIGPTAGRLWSFDEGEEREIADSLSDYLETLIYLAENGMIDPTQSARYLTFHDSGELWGPAALSG